MTDQELKELSDKYYVYQYECVESKDYEGIDYDEFDEFLNLLQEWRGKYDRVEIDCYDGNGGFSYNPHAHFTVRASRKISREMIVRKIEEKRDAELKQKQLEEEFQKQYDMGLLKNLRKKYPGEFIQ